MRWISVVAVAVFLTAAQLLAGEHDSVVAYGGWENCIELRAPEAKASALLVPDIGARLIRYELNGTNILFDNPDSRGRSIAKDPKPFWAGGYQIDVGPEMRGIPPHRDMWMGAWGVRQSDRGPWIATSPDDKTLGLRLEKRIAMNEKTGALSVAQKMVNISDAGRKYCLWDRTLCEGGGYALIQLNPKSRYKAGWCWGSRDEKSPGGWRYDGDSPAAPEVKIIDGVLVAHCFGKHSKLGSDTHAGWIAYARGRLVFIKKFQVDPRGEYTDGGMSVALYFSDRVAELEPISPEVTLSPGAEYAFDETWHLLALDEPIDSHEKARTLLPKIEAAVKGN